MSAYVFVQDIPASWEHYEPLAAALGEPVPEGLILHVAGPTDEGFRTIDVWETREAWERFQSDRPTPVAAPAWAPPTVRELRAVNTVRGGWPDW
jgi:hypothetical protein